MHTFSLNNEPGDDGIPSHPSEPNQPSDALLILLPLLIVLSTLLFVLLLFLLSVIFLRRRRGIILRDHDGPVDLSREDIVEGEGGFETIENRWLESVSEEERRSYQRAKDFQIQYPPNSLPTDITLSQFLSIQEKGVSAWSFEPDYESMNNLLVHARTELTFLPDPSSSSSVQSNLPLPKLNEVYYWEVKMFDLPPTTTVSVGLATKPYPAFRLPGISRFSVAYHSNGDKSHNYPFTATSFGSSLKEGDVLGIGYRPRTGTVFFTRNGRKTEDAFIGLAKWNLFPTVGADGPCSVHVNLGQAGFVHIEANVKKWGLAPSVGTLAPPPAYGSERGSILLEAGGARVQQPPSATPIGRSSPPQPRDAPSTSMSPPRRSIRPPRRPKASTAPVQSSPLRGTPITQTPPPASIREEEEEEGASLREGPSQPRYISPTDRDFNARDGHPFDGAGEDDADGVRETGDRDAEEWSSGSGEHSPTPSRITIPERPQQLDREREESPSSSQEPANPPTPHVSDIYLRPMISDNRVEPPAYSHIDAFTYPDGVAIDLPADVIAAALEERPPTQLQQRRR